MLAFLSKSAPWASWRPATCLPDDCFCETLRTGYVAQPANTLSSFAFVAVALFVAFRWRRSAKSGKTTLSRTECALFMASLVLAGLGSTFYHASFTFVGQVFDVSGMYFVATFILLHRLGPRWSLSPVGSGLGFVALNAALMAAQVTTPSMRRAGFAVLLVAALTVEWRAARAGRLWLARGAGLMTLAFVIWVIDRERLLCDPDSLIQGHAIWHLLGAFASACLYWSYEAEGNAVTS